MNTQIVWNGCDSYIEVESLDRSGLDFSFVNGKAIVFHGSQSFEAFDAIEISVDSLPKDDDGEPDFDGVLGSETSGKFYKSL